MDRFANDIRKKDKEVMPTFYNVLLRENEHCMTFV